MKQPRPRAGARWRRTRQRTRLVYSAVETSEPVNGTLASQRAAVDIYRRLAKSDSARRWCARYDLSPLPASGPDVAAFLAGERGRKLSSETLKLRRAAIRYLHRAAGCSVPNGNVCGSETMAGITRKAPRIVLSQEEGRRHSDHPTPTSDADRE